MLSIIAAIGKNNELGYKDKMPWHLPDDLKRFRRITTGHTLIMGRKTFESLQNTTRTQTYCYYQKQFI